MIGAILGDVCGSRFEFDNHKSKEFELFHRDCTFTDDTVMTLAVAKALLEYDREKGMEHFKRTLIRAMHDLGERYPDCGYGGRFLLWVLEKRRRPYGSFGNGSGMRVSPVAWVARNLAECEALAVASASVTHNHPEGIRGAVAVAGATYLARVGKSREEIRRYLEGFYRLDFTLDEIRPTYGFDETCQGSVPQALVAFLESESFEDALRNAVSIGGDSDTVAAMTGAIAEAFYGVDPELADTGRSFLDGELLQITDDFNNTYRKETER